MSDCLRCQRPETAKIHDVIGRQGTGTAAVHAFVGEREAVILRYAAGQLGWEKKSRPHAHTQPPDIMQWNNAIEAAKSALVKMTTAIDPAELADYDEYWQDAAAPVVPSPDCGDAGHPLTCNCYPYRSGSNSIAPVVR